MIDFVEDLVRSTTIADGHTKVHTVEHVLSALSGCSVDNVLIEMDASAGLFEHPAAVQAHDPNMFCRCSTMGKSGRT